MLTTILYNKDQEDLVLMVDVISDEVLLQICSVEDGNPKSAYLVKEGVTIDLNTFLNAINALTASSSGVSIADMVKHDFTK